MRENRKALGLALGAALVAAGGAYLATAGANAQVTGSVPAASDEADKLAATFSDQQYAQRIAYFKTVSDEIPVNPANFPESVVKLHSETFADLAEKEPRRTNWMTLTDSGWLSAGGADMYEVHKALTAGARSVKDGKTIIGPVVITDAMNVDVKNRANRVEARFGNKILGFKTAANRMAYEELVKAGSVIELQDMQCAMAPVHPKRPHLAGASLMVVSAVEEKGKAGQPLLVKTYNSHHVHFKYDLLACADMSNAAFKKLSDEGRSALGAAVLVRAKKLDDMSVPAYSTPAPAQDVTCKPLT